MILKRPKITPGRQLSVKAQGTLLSLGNIYSFNYTPIYEQKLKFYDVKPLVLFMEYRPQYNTFFGVNLHYLPLDEREFLARHVEDNRGFLERELRWDVLYNKAEFRFMPIGFRQYKLRNVVNIETVYDVDGEEDVDREDLKIRRRSMIPNPINYNQDVSRRLTRLAKQNREWYSFLKSL